jgi:glycosyltransferase involved in cell wall biosynthesis
VGIEFLGHRNDVATLLRSCDIAVHASISPDPLPGTVLEAMLAEAATIASSAGGVLEMITDPSIGVLVPPGDAAALARALSNLLTGAPPRQVYGPAARAKALELTDAARIDKQLDRLYQRLARPGAGIT